MTWKYFKSKLTVVSACGNFIFRCTWKSVCSYVVRRGWLATPPALEVFHVRTLWQHCVLHSMYVYVVCMYVGVLDVSDNVYWGTKLSTRLRRCTNKCVCMIILCAITKCMWRINCVKESHVVVNTLKIYVHLYHTLFSRLFSECELG